MSARKRGYADGGSGDDSQESASKPKRMREDSRDDKEKSMCARCSGLEAVSEDRWGGRDSRAKGEEHRVVALTGEGRGAGLCKCTLANGSRS